MVRRPQFAKYAIVEVINRALVINLYNLTWNFDVLQPELTRATLYVFPSVDAALAAVRLVDPEQWHDIDI